MIDTKALPKTPSQQSIDWYSEIADTHTPENLGPNQAEMLSRQTSFLDAFVKYGNIAEAAETARIRRPTVALWRSEDKLGFRGRFTEANDAYLDGIEGKLRELAVESRNFQALKAILDAGRPSKWREKSSLDSSTADLLAALGKQATSPPVRAPGAQWPQPGPLSPQGDGAPGRNDP